MEDNLSKEDRGEGPRNWLGWLVSEETGKVAGAEAPAPGPGCGPNLLVTGRKPVVRGSDTPGLAPAGVPWGEEQRRRPRSEVCGQAVSTAQKHLCPPGLKRTCAHLERVGTFMLHSHSLLGGRATLALPMLCRPKR